MVEASSSPPLSMLECWLTQCYLGFIQVTLFAVSSKYDSHVKSRIEHFTTLLPILQLSCFPPSPLWCALEEWHRRPFWIICTQQSSFPALWLIKIVCIDWCPLQKASSLSLTTALVYDDIYSEDGFLCIFSKTMAIFLLGTDIFLVLLAQSWVQTIIPW